jgi:hypothetical protein
MIAGERLPNWARPVLEKLSKSTFAEAICYLCLNHRADEKFKVLSIKKVNNEKSIELVYSTDTESLHSQFFALNIDFVLCLSRKTPSENFIGGAPHGWWRYRFGNHLDIDDMGMDELIEGKKTQKVSFEMISFSAETETILKEGNFKFYTHSLKYHRRATVEQCSSWPADIAKQIAIQGSIDGSQRIVKSVKTLSLLKKIQVLIIQLQAKLQFEVEKISRQFVFQQWNIGTIPLPLKDVLDGAGLKNVNWWASPKVPLCFADPFPVIVDDQLFVLAEKFSYLNPVGAITSFATDEAGQMIGEQEALRFPYHLSYPCMVKVNEKLFASFEALQSRELAIYECKKFPQFWVRKTRIASGTYADPTLFEYEGRWWVFATAYDHYSEGNSSLYAWYSETGLTGKWEAHKQNPIKCDIESSRSAGTPFYKDGKLYRPSQNCAQYYGHSIYINEVRKLSPEEFCEVKDKEILPDSRYPNGIHHLSGTENWTIIDGRRDQFLFFMGLKKIWRHLIPSKPWFSISKNKENQYKNALTQVLSKSSQILHQESERL